MTLNTLAKVKIGCAGWALSSKSKPDFPAPGSHLERYSKVFSAVEINTSFYRSHRPATYARWRDSVPEDFSFSVKLPRTITHQYRLQKTEALLSQFLAETAHLSNKLDCLLLQLPPSLPFDTAIAGQFFKHLRLQTDVAMVCEPRHVSWFSIETSDMLRHYDIGAVFADPMPVPNVSMSGSLRTLYHRLHGSPIMYKSSYEDIFIELMAERIKRTIAAADSIWCIFDNTTNGEAIQNALLIQRYLLQV